MMRAERESILRPEAPAARKNGTLSVTYERGFGFIRPDDGGRDVFVRATDVPEGCWKIGQRLSFGCEPPVKGNSWRAVEVRAA